MRGWISAGSCRCWFRRRLPFFGVSVFLIALFLPNYASANDVLLNEMPTSWRLQNYVPDGITVWFTGSSCANGQMLFASNATKDDKNRFFALILAAKTAGKRVYVYYDNSTVPGGCLINSFGLDSGQ